MKNKNLLYVFLAVVLPFSYAILGSNSGGITGKSTTSCTPCHGSTLNTATTITVTGIPSSGFNAGQTYTMTLVVANTSYTNAANRAGFNLTVNSGTLAAGSGMNLTGTQELAHSTPVTMASTGSASWTFDWTAPAAPTGPVVFSVAGNATDGDGGTLNDAHNATATTFQMAGTSAGIPTVANVASASITDVAAAISAMITANNASTTANVEYGLTTSYGSNAAMTPASITGSTATAASANLTGLTPNTTYHYRISATNAVGTTNSPDATFKTNFANQIVDINKITYEVYPNPANGNRISISFGEDIKTAQAYLTTLGGKKVRVLQTSFEKNTMKLDISNIATGTYILQAEINENMIFEKLVIQ